MTNQLIPLTGEEIELPTSHYRLCYNRAGIPSGDIWRVRDERNGDLRLVKKIEGEVNFSWMDKGSHVFHDGKVRIDEEGIAHLIDDEVA